MCRDSLDRAAVLSVIRGIRIGRVPNREDHPEGALMFGVAQRTRGGPHVCGEAHHSTSEGSNAMSRATTAEAAGARPDPQERAPGTRGADAKLAPGAAGIRRRLCRDLRIGDVVRHHRSALPRPALPLPKTSSAQVEVGVRDARGLGRGCSDWCSRAACDHPGVIAGRAAATGLPDRGESVRRAAPAAHERSGQAHRDPRPAPSDHGAGAPTRWREDPVLSRRSRVPGSVAARPVLGGAAQDSAGGASGHGAAPAP